MDFGTLLHRFGDTVLDGSLGRPSDGRLDYFSRQLSLLETESADFVLGKGVVGDRVNVEFHLKDRSNKILV